MPITYYPNSRIKKPYNPIDKQQKKKTILSETNKVDLTASGMNYTLWHPSDKWVVHEILMHFGATTARNYSVNKVIGRGIISSLNDSLYFQTSGSPAQRIILSQGFYTGSQLASELKTQMDGNQAFIDAGATPFTITYNGTTGKFTIVAAGLSQIQYFVLNVAVNVNKDSTASEVIGFNADSAMANTLVGDTAVFGLGDNIPINAETGSTDLNTIVNMDSLSPNFDVDGALNIIISVTKDTTVDYKITYEENF